MTGWGTGYVSYCFGVKEDTFQMNKFNLHVLLLLGALVFCVGLINMTSNSNPHAYEVEVSNGLNVIPTLSSSVYHYQQELSMPEVEEGHSPSNIYLDIIKHEIQAVENIQNQVAEVKPEVEIKHPVKPVKAVKPTTTKKKPAKKKKNYVERWALVTAYCPCSKCCGYATPGRTSIGKSAWKPGIAADPRAIAYGTEVYVKGYGRKKVDDTGGAMRRSWRRKGVLHLDIRMTYHYQAVKWGRRMMKVRIYNKK